MNYRITTIFLAAALLLVLGVNITQAAPIDHPSTSVNLLATAGDYDFGAHGTAWVPERSGAFAVFKPYGWGIETRAKAAGYQWVHISVPVATRIADSRMLIKYVEFCAQSTNGAISKPVRLDLWDYNGRFYSATIAWPATNNKYCFGHTFSSPFAFEGLGSGRSINSLVITGISIFLFQGSATRPPIRLHRLDLLVVVLNLLYGLCLLVKEANSRLQAAPGALTGRRGIPKNRGAGIHPHPYFQVSLGNSVIY